MVTSHSPTLEIVLLLLSLEWFPRMFYLTTSRHPSNTVLRLLLAYLFLTSTLPVSAARAVQTKAKATPAAPARKSAQEAPRQNTRAPKERITPNALQANGKLAFSSNRGGNFEIYLMNANGTGLVNISNNPSLDSEPAFSPDGTKIVFVTDRDGNEEIYVMNADGTNQTRLTNDANFDYEPAFSPEGGKIVFTSERTGNAEIHVMNSDGSGLVNLTNHPDGDGSASFSPDGSKIVFESDRDGGDGEIYLMNADGTNQTRLTTTGGFTPSFSPDGSKITYTTGSSGVGNAIAVMNPDGTNQTAVTVNLASDENSAFSPDGSKIVFVSDRDGNKEIYLMNPDGTGQTRLTNDAASDIDPAWQTLLSCAPPPPNGVAWYRAADTASDEIGTNHGTFQNGATTGSGFVGAAFAFDGVDDFVQVPHSSSLNPASSLTIDAWIFVTSDQDSTIVGKWGDTGAFDAQRAYLFSYQPGGRLRFAVTDAVTYQNDPSFHNFDSPTGIVSLNTWTHVAAVYDQTSGTRTIYRNGAQVAQRTDAPINIMSSIADLGIGAKVFAPNSPNALLAGKVDEAEIYFRALTATEVKNIYDSKNAGKCLAGTAQNITVSNTNDSGPGSLRQAILDANASPGAQTINFQIPGAGVQTITPDTPLPQITDPVIIDGYTQPGASPNTLDMGNDAVLLIELDGTNANIDTGLQLLGGNTTVRGLVINRFLYGVALVSNNNVVAGNFIGTDAAGTAALGNINHGVSIVSATNNTIGGATPEARNLISGNVIGIIFENNSDANTVQNNYIGTDKNGTADLGNTNAGIYIYNNSDNNIIGGTTAAARNVISGNDSHGVHLDAPIVNGNIVQGNYIGTQANGTSALANNGNGIHLDAVGANRIGGTAAGAGNTIAFNDGRGVALTNATTTRVAIGSNSIHSNTNIGIDLGNNGVTANDAGDTDTGANNLQNFPVLTSVTGGGGNTVIQGTLNSTAATAFRVEFFSNAACDASGNGEGRTFLGSTAVTTDASGNATINAMLSSATAGGEAVTATATDPAGSTSEFSACASVSIAAAEMNVRGNGVSIADGDATPAAADHTDFGNAPVSGVTAERTFTIENTGGAALNLTGTPAVNITGADAADFTVTVQPASPVNGGGTTIFTVSFDPSASGLRSATVQIANDDADENPYDFSIQGTGTVPPVLGNYGNTSVALGANTTITPDAAPTGTTSINVSTSTNFKGTLTANTTTGVVHVTDAHPAGTYTVTVRAFGAGGMTTKTFTLTVTTPATCNPLTFATTNFTAGIGPYSVAVGDFNNDGNQDLAVPNYTSANVSILLGNGAGSFSAAANFGVGLGPFSVAVGDFNNDGNQDLAVSHRDSNFVSVLLGTGMGSFSAAANYNVGNTPLKVAVGDFNGDGNQDLAVANFGSDSVSILLGTGMGSFSAATNFGAGSTPDAVAVGDFDGDGDQDLAVASFNSGNVSVLLGTGTGSFPAITSFGAGSNPRSLAIGDFNGDGNQDIAIPNSNTDTVSVLLGNGMGGFPATTNFQVGDFPISIAVGDFNGDGNQDLTTANTNSDNLSVLLGNGAGSFSAATNFGVGDDPYSVAVGDFNGDGKQDIATPNATSNNVSVLLRQCAPAITAGAALTRQQGTAASNSTIATVSDAETSAGSLMVAATNVPSGITVSNIVNTGGTITADVAASCTAATGANTVELTVTDGAGATATANLTVNVSANTAPTLTYTQPPAINFGGSTTINPATGPSDNGSVSNIVVQSQGTYTGTISVDSTTGAVSVNNATPSGTHTITIRATDNCGAITDATFDLTVNAATIFSVTNTNDTGAGSLRQAIIDSNNTPGVQGINFQIPGAGVQTITPASPLPQIAGAVVIDGYTQPGASANTQASGNNAVLLVELNGANAGVGAHGLDISAGGTTIKGLVINRFFDGTGINISGGSNNRIEGNFIGTNAAGTAALANNRGVDVASSQNNIIGGTSPAARNLLSGNSQGLQLFFGATGTLVQGNYIGTTASGTTALPNTLVGLLLNVTSGNTVGGTAAGAGNLISGNATGLFITQGSMNNTVQGNFVGTAADGVTALPNTARGVLIAQSSNGNTIGGAAAGAGNTVAFNNGDGVIVDASVNNTITGNSIHSNAALGLDLMPAGITANDAGDTDTGANNLQNFPVLSAVTVAGGNTTFNGTLASTANTTYTLHFYSNDACDSSGNGEGQTYLGTAVLTTDASGDATFNSTINGLAVPLNQFVTATATDPSGSTSEFSACRQVTNTFTISGQILEGANGLSGVTVTLSGSLSAITITNASGNYSFSGVAAGGNYVITPSLVNYTFAPPSQSFNNLSADQTANFAATLNTHTISGQVTEGVNGLGGVTMTLSGAQSATTTTDASGNYSFTNLAAGGNYVVAPSRPNYSFAPSSRAFSNLSANQTGNFAATLNTVTISGQVTEAGNALAGVTITLSGTQSGTATTDANGNYTFNVSSGGDYVIIPSLTHYTFNPAGRAVNNLTSNLTANFDATRNTHSIGGQIRDNNNAPLIGVTVNLSGGQSATTTTDANGNYSFANLPAGSNYIVTPTLANYAFAPASTAFNNLSANQTANFTGTLGAHTISGRVADGSNNSLPNVTITLSGAQSGTALTDAGGNYAFNVAAGASYTVTPSRANYTFAPPSASFNNISANQTANFTGTLQTFNIGGRIADGNNNGIAGVNVALSGGQTAATTTDASGNYSFANLPAGANYTVTPSLANYTFAPPNATFNNLSANATANFLAFAQPTQPQPVSGRVVDSNGNGIANVTLYATNATTGASVCSAPPGASVCSTTTDANGNYTLMLPPGGDYTITTAKIGLTFQPAARTFDNLSGGQTSNFTATEGLSISGRVTGVNGNGIGNVIVTLSGEVTRTVLTLPNGSFLFTNLPANGDYVLQADSGHLTFSPSQIVRPDLNSDLTINLDAAPRPAPVPTPPIEEDFSGTTRDPLKFTEGTLTQPAGSKDPLVTVVQEGGVLKITPRSGISEASFNGYVTSRAIDFTDATASVEITQTADNGAQTIFGVGRDERNFFRFVAQDVDDPTIPTAKAGALTKRAAGLRRLIFQARSAGVLNGLSSSIPYDPVQHRYWRFRHSSIESAMFFETSPDRVNWTEQRRVALAGPIGLLAAELSAGTSGLVTNPGQAIFDNLLVQPSKLVNRVIEDDFEGTTRDPLRFTEGTFTQPTSSRDPLVLVVQEGGKLKITPRAGISQPSFNGYVSARAVDFTDAEASVEVNQTADNGAQTIFAIGRDEDNFFRFVAQDVDAPPLSSNEAGAATTRSLGLRRLIFQARGLGVLNSLSASIEYNSNDHHYWRFRHISAQNVMLFETSPNHVDWTEQRRVALGAPIGALNVELSAGTSGSVTNPGQAIFDNLLVQPSVFNGTSRVRLAQSAYRVSEGAGVLTLKVTRVGDTSRETRIDYATEPHDGQPCNTQDGDTQDGDTQDRKARARCDFGTTAGAIRFAPGETEKTFTVFITDDIYVEGDETVRIALGFPSTGIIGEPASALVTIADNDARPLPPHPINTAPFLVRQQYLDFLNREPEENGFNAWVGVLRGCAFEGHFGPGKSGSDPACDRITVSSSFFRSSEFAIKGYFVYRFYKASLGRAPSYEEFLRDMTSVTGQTEAEVVARREAFAQAWVERADFVALNEGITNAEFVDQLAATAGVPIAGRTQLVSDLNQKCATLSEECNKARAKVLRDVVDSPELFNREYNAAFVLMQYFGYLQRDPDEAGYNGWLNLLNGTGDYRTMIFGFLYSQEYLMRFGQP